METLASLNSEASPYTPVPLFHFRPAPIATTHHFPPPPPPSSPQLLHYHYYPHFFPVIYPLPEKPPPLHLPPQPPPPPYTDTSFQTSLILEQPPPPPLTVDSFANPSAERVESVQKAFNPVTSGPRFRPMVDKFRGSRVRKKEFSPEKKVHLNDGIPTGPKLKFGERKSTGSNKAVWVKKRIGSKEIIPLREDEGKTTIMIKNIPSKYTREMLMKFLDKHCNKENERANHLILAGDEFVSAYDFVYLPIDFFTRLNKGYAFVNFTNPKSVWKFYDAFNGEFWECFNSRKIIDIVSAKIQGKEALVDHFERSHFRCDTDEYLPLWLDPARDGSGAPVSLRPLGYRLSPRCRLLY